MSLNKNVTCVTTPIEAYLLLSDLSLSFYMKRHVELITFTKFQDDSFIIFHMALPKVIFLLRVSPQNSAKKNHHIFCMYGIDVIIFAFNVNNKVCTWEKIEFFVN